LADNSHSFANCRSGISGSRSQQSRTNAASTPFSSGRQERTNSPFPLQPSLAWVASLGSLSSQADSRSSPFRQPTRRTSTDHVCRLSQEGGIVPADDAWHHLRNRTEPCCQSHRVCWRLL
jgi:hypothetical protein